MRFNSVVQYVNQIQVHKLDDVPQVQKDLIDTINSENVTYDDYFQGVANLTNDHFCRMIQTFLISDFIVTTDSVPKLPSLEFQTHQDVFVDQQPLKYLFDYPVEIFGARLAIESVDLVKNYTLIKHKPTKRVTQTEANAQLVQPIVFS